MENWERRSWCQPREEQKSNRAMENICWMLQLSSEISTRLFEAKVCFSQMEGGVNLSRIDYIPKFNLTKIITNFSFHPHYKLFLPLILQFPILLVAYLLATSNSFLAGEFGSNSTARSKSTKSSDQFLVASILNNSTRVSNSPAIA